MRSVWEISRELQILDDAFESWGDEAPQEMHDFWGELTDNFEAMADDVANYLRFKRAEAEGLENQAKRFKAEAEKTREFIDRTKLAMKTGMETAGLKTCGPFRVQANGGKRKLFWDGLRVTDDYMRMEPQIDTAKIREALDRGEVLDFAHLEPQGSHLRMRN